MAYDHGLAQRIRELLDERTGVTETHMFGGLSFLLFGNMSVGIVKDDLCVRCGPDRFAELVARNHARPMDFTGRPMKGWIFVGPAGYESDEDLSAWVDSGVAFAASLPAKDKTAKKKKT